MKVITGDMVGLIKITDYKPNLAANKKTKVENTSASITHGKVDRNKAIWKMFPTTDTEVFVARKNSIELTSLETNDILKSWPGPTKAICLYSYNGLLITCSDEGTVTYINYDDNTHNISDISISLGISNLECMRVHPTQPNIFATGGQELDLCVWDIKLANDGHITPMWQAQNVPDDFLGLSVPIWITDIKWLDHENISTLATCTAYHQIRKYNIKEQSPTHSFEVANVSKLLSLSVSPEGHEFIVSDVKGAVVAIDSHTGKMRGSFKGCAGAVVETVYCKTLPLVVTIGSDRYLRVFESSGKRRLVQNTYLKQSLTSMIIDEKTQESVPDEWDELQTIEDNHVKKRE